MEPIGLKVNGKAVSVTADEQTPLLDILRNHLGLMGTKFGCGLEQCGCCMVLLDGKPEESCGKPLSVVAGKEIVTIEGLGMPGRPHPLQQAFIEEQAGQCGYCLPGIVISAKALLDRNPPTLVRPNQRRYETSRLSGVLYVPAIRWRKAARFSLCPTPVVPVPPRRKPPRQSRTSDALAPRSTG